MSFFFFHFRLLAPVDRRGQHLRAFSGSCSSGTQPLLLGFQPVPLCPSLPQVPATASFCLVAKSIISLGICLFHPSLPLSPPSRNLIPSRQAEGQKSLKGTTLTAHAQVLPLHMLPNASLLSSLLHHILFLCDALVVT